VVPSRLSRCVGSELLVTRRLRRLMGKGTDRVSSPRPAKAGEGGPGLATTHAGGGRVMTKLTKLRSVRWKDRQQGFIYSWSVSTYRTPRDV
jgi:hypothetical protein